MAFKFLGWYVAVIAIALLLVQHCNSKQDPYDRIDSTSTSVIKENIFAGTTNQSDKGNDSLQYVPYPVYHTDSFYKDVDTAGILRSFFERKIYTNLYEDSVLKELIIDTVERNRIIGRHRTYTVRCKDTITTNTITKIKSANGLYIGLESDLKGFGPGASYVYKNSLFKVGYSLNQKSLTLGYYYKFK